MTAPTTFLAETHERFLKAIVEKLPVERIIELHLFPSIKQGGMESGVAVVAAVPEGETAVATRPSAVEDASIESGEPEDAVEGAEGREPGADGRTMTLDALVSDDELPAALHEPSDVAEAAAQHGETDPEMLQEIEAEAAEATAGIEAQDAERLEDAVHEIEDAMIDPAAQSMAVASLEIADLPPVDERPRRYTIYAARYRLVLKGPDRGKWEVAVTPEADAPLVTVESVVRGVQRRSGDADEVGRWTGEELKLALKI